VVAECIATSAARVIGSDGMPSIEWLVLALTSVARHFA
jgi:hypothetical protein